MTQETRFRAPLFQAKLHGVVIGWYDTADEADAALDAAQAAEAREQDELERDLFGPAGCPGAH